MYKRTSNAEFGHLLPMVFLLIHLCLSSANQCLENHAFQIEPDKRDTKLNGFTYQIFEMTGPKTCFNKCILRPECHSYNYNRPLLRCEINIQAKNYSVDDFKYEDGFVFVDIKKYRENSFCDPCFDKPCTHGEICQKLSQGSNVCIKDYESSFCEDDWLYFGGYCYNFRNIQKSWHNAQEDCKGRTSNLIKIENDEENTWIVSTFLTAQTIDSLWIGASDILDEGQWIWVSDGSNLTFSLWNDNEPNNAGTGEDCCEIEMGWNDSPCDLTNPYVCKKKSR